MRTKLNLLVAGIFLTVANAGFGQSILQFSATTYSVPEWPAPSPSPSSGPMTSARK